MSPPVLSWLPEVQTAVLPFAGGGSRSSWYLGELFAGDHTAPEWSEQN